MFTEITDFFLRAVNQLLAFFYSLPVVGGSYGIAIILLTLTVMVLLMPLTLRATKSQIKMMQLQPLMKDLQKQYKDDKATLNQEMMALYQREGINPVGGCVPMLAQMPVFLILFRVLRDLTRRWSDAPFFQVSNHALEITGHVTDQGEHFDPHNLEVSTKLYQDLTQATELRFLGIFDLSKTASEVFSSSIFAAIPYLILIVIVVGSSYYQQRQIQARRGDQPQELTQQQQTQQQLLKILPLMSGVWSFAFPAGLVLYWATSNVFRIGQQSYITRSLYRGDAPGAKLLQQQTEDREKKSDTGSDEQDADADNESDSDNTSKKPSSKKSSSKRSGNKGEVASTSDESASSSSSGNRGRSRSEEWQRMREERERQRKARTNSSSASNNGAVSSRVTPKGTQPKSKKRKKR